MRIEINPTVLKLMRTIQIREEFEELTKQYEAAMTIQKEALETGDTEKAIYYVNKANDAVVKRIRLLAELKALGELEAKDEQ